MKKIPMEKVKPKKHGALWWIFIGWWWMIIVYSFVIVFNLIVGLIPKKETEQKTVQNVQPTVTPTVAKEAPKYKFMCGKDRFKTRIDDFILAYNYKNSICFLKETKTEDIKKLLDKGGKEITFELEPTNPYDENAVQILLDGEKIGYVYKGDTQNIIHSWIEKGWKFFAYICQYSIEEEKASYAIGFYKPYDSFETKSYKLTKITKKCAEFASQSRFEALEGCDEGNEVEIEYSYETMSFVVTDRFANEIGEMPSRFEDEAENGRKYYAEIESVDIGDTAKAIIKVYM